MVTSCASQFSAIGLAISSTSPLWLTGRPECATFGKAVN
jgi:hypothetical protein